MKKNNTPETYMPKEKVVVPSDKTVNFLKSFARSIYAEKKITVSLNTVCIN